MPLVVLAGVAAVVATAALSLYTWLVIALGYCDEHGESALCGNGNPLAIMLFVLPPAMALAGAVVAGARGSWLPYLVGVCAAIALPLFLLIRLEHLL